jgi:hypothetical protein
MRTDKFGSDIVFRFDGFSDLARSANERRDKDGSSSKTYDKEWYASDNFDHASSLLVDGWDGPTREIMRITDSVRETIGEVVKPLIQFAMNVYAPRVDIGMWATGDPNCFIECYEEDGLRPERFVRLLIDSTFSAMVSPKDIITRGAAVIALCDALNLCGYSTEVFTVCAVSSGKDKCFSIIPVQTAGQPWDVRSAIMPLAHPSFLRRMHFGIIEGGGEQVTRKFGSGNGYGTPCGVSKGDRADELVGGADIILSGQKGSISDIVSDPSAWVVAQLKKCGALL